MVIDTMFARDMYQVYEINDDLFTIEGLLWRSAYNTFALNRSCDDDRIASV